MYWFNLDSLVLFPQLQNTQMYAGGHQKGPRHSVKREEGKSNLPLEEKETYEVTFLPLLNKN